jgi:serine/threonine protein kinase
MSAAAPLVVSRVLGRRLGGRYRVDTVLATGGMGAVFRAEDERLHRPVAVKVLTLHADNPALEAELRRWFQREARAAASLRHPNVVTVHDFGSDAELDLDFLVMELLPGRDVAGRLAEAGAPLTTAEALEVFREAGMGLAAGHRAGIVHRDVKPRNIFLVEDPDGGWEVKLLDFGIADAVEAGTAVAAGGKPGPHTPRYAAPEQLRGEPATPASDVYSLGLTAMEMLCGRHPEELRGATDAGPAARRLAALCAADRTLRPAIVQVLLRAVHPDPARRFADAGELLRALEPALGTPYGTLRLEPAPYPAPAPAPPPAPAAASSSRTLRPDPDGTAPLAPAAPKPRPLPSAATAGLARRRIASGEASARNDNGPARPGADPEPVRPAPGFALLLILIILAGPFAAIAARDGVRAAWDTYAGVFRNEGGNAAVPDPPNEAAGATGADGAPGLDGADGADGAPGLDGADAGAAPAAGDDWSPVAQAEYERVTRLGYTPEDAMEFRVAAFPPDRIADARAVVEELWSRGEAAGVADHHVYPLLESGYVYAVMGPSDMMTLIRKQRLVFDLQMRYGVIFMLRPLALRRPP